MVGGKEEGPISCCIFGSGWRSLILVLEGRKGWGWSRFGAELSKVKAFYDSTVGSHAEMLGPPIGVLFDGEERWVKAGCGCISPR
jgi:hypothetical protein